MLRSSWLRLLIRGGLEAIMGTIAGDDTVIVITRDPNGGAALAESFLDWSAAQ